VASPRPCPVCGSSFAGRKSRRFCSDACRVKNHRRGTSSSLVRVPDKTENPLHGAKPAPECAGDLNVTPTDTAVRCSSCGELMSDLVGPLPVATFCKDCVAAGGCPCSSRPVWHRRGLGP